MDPCGGEDGAWHLQVKDTLRRKPGKICEFDLMFVPKQDVSKTEQLRHVVGQDYSQHLTVIPKRERLRS